MELTKIVNGLKNTARAIPIVAMGYFTTACGGKENLYNPEYDFHDNIGDLHLEFLEEEAGFGATNVLKVKYPDGRTIEYVDNDGSNDFELDEIIVTEACGKQHSYDTKDPVGEQLVESQQELFNTYLKSIKQIKLDKGMQLLNPRIYSK